MTNTAALQEINSTLQTRIDNFEPNDVLFFSGAGISAPAPTNLFLGNELHNLLLDYFTFIDDPFRKIVLQHKALESTINAFYSYFNLTSIDNLFNLLLIWLFSFQSTGSAKINEYHQYFHRHIELGGRHFTVNLDQFVENGGSQPLSPYIVNTTEQLNVPNFQFPNSYLYKIHGDPEGTTFGNHGFLSEVLRSGFSQTVKNQWKKELATAQLVVFIGYGGVDKFDIIPFFQELNDNFFPGKAIWIRYTQAGHKIEEPSKAEDSILRTFTDSVVISVPPEQILNSLFSNSLPTVSNVHSRNYSNDVYLRYWHQNYRISIIDKIALSAVVPIAW